MSSFSQLLEFICGDDADGLIARLNEQPDLAGACDDNGVSLLMQALYHGKRHLAELVADHLAELDIFAACALGRELRSSELLAQQPDLATTWSPDGFTPLHLACFFGAPAVLDHLLGAGADVNAIARNPMKVRPLNSAVATGQEACVHTLLAAGAWVDGNQHGAITPLMGAAASGNERLVEMLLAKGADRTLSSDGGQTAADYADERGHQALSIRLRQGT